MTRPRWNLRSLWDQIARHRAGTDERMRVVNVSRGTVLATHLKVANTGAKRNKGLLGRKELGAGEGLWIVPCESVHTFFMKFAIDLVYLDRKNQIVKVRNNVRPWRISACLPAHSVLELPSGTALASQSRKGDRIEFAVTPEPVADDREHAAQTASLYSVEGGS